MEAGWGDVRMRLDEAGLDLERAGAPPVAIPLPALEGFTLVPREGPRATGRAASWTPDAELVVGWRRPDGKQASARLPVPAEALQVQLFLTRLAQLRPEADLRGLPLPEALARLGVEAPRGGGIRWRRALAVLLVLAVLGALAAVWRLAR
jgi:hypothetical protein